MRIPYLLAVLLFGIVSVCTAGDQPKQIPSQMAVAAQPSDSDLFDSSLGIFHTDMAQIVEDGRRDPNHRYSHRERDSEVTCYKMRSYLVARESPDSDVVGPAGYSTCQPASKYGVKRADKPANAPAR